MKHDPSVVIISWQRSELGYSSLRYETFFVSCHRLMTTVRAWLFISKVWNMLRHLSSWHDNGQSMVIRPYGMKHAPTVVIASRQRSEHGFIIPMVWNMLRQLSSSHENVKSMVIHLLGMKHALTVVIVTWQRSEHGYSSLRYETFFVSCHRLMTTVRAWSFIP